MVGNPYSSTAFSHAQAYACHTSTGAATAVALPAVESRFTRIGHNTAGHIQMQLQPLRAQHSGPCLDAATAALQSLTWYTRIALVSVSIKSFNVVAMIATAASNAGLIEPHLVHTDSLVICQHLI